MTFPRRAWLPQTSAAWDQSLMARYGKPVVAPAPAAVPAPVAVPAAPRQAAAPKSLWNPGAISYGAPDPVSGAYGGLPEFAQNAFTAPPAMAVPESVGAAFPSFGMPSDIPDGMGFGSDAPASFMPAYGADAGSSGWMPDWLQGAIGTKDNPGWGGFALGAANSAASMFFGMQQYGLAKDTLNENKRQFQMNYDAQKQTTNTALEDRQRARVASNAGAYESVGSYMDKNGVK